MDDTESEFPKFPLGPAEKLYSCPILGVYSRKAKTDLGSGDPAVIEKDMYFLKCSNWVNVIPVTADGHIVLIEQHRFGTDTVTLETPGGAVDPGENDTTMAALRELEEETRLTSSRIIALPGYFPNPAIQSNRVQFFIAFDCHPVAKISKHFDPFERIRLKFVPLEEAVQKARSGQITHSLAALALLLAEPYLTGRVSKINANER
jgi:ADP-ribose pyrophosphatase